MGDNFLLLLVGSGLGFIYEVTYVLVLPLGNLSATTFGILR